MAGKLSQWSLTTLFHYRSKVQRQPVTALRVSNPYHAVSIVPGLYDCKQCKALDGERFLSAEAPTLPLSGCDSEKCSCRYQHHGDRRHNGDRRHREVWNNTQVWSGGERRGSPGRRVTDQ